MPSSFPREKKADQTQDSQTGKFGRGETGPVVRWLNSQPVSPMFSPPSRVLRETKRTRSRLAATLTERSMKGRSMQPSKRISLSHHTAEKRKVGLISTSHRGEVRQPKTHTHTHAVQYSVRLPSWGGHTSEHTNLHHGPVTAKCTVQLGKARQTLRSCRIESSSSEGP